MMKFKKFLAAAMMGAMMLGVVATAAPAVAVYADTQKDKSDYEVEINYKDFTATIISKAESKSDVFVVLEVLKDEQATKVSATYVYPVEAIYEEAAAEPASKELKQVGFGVTVDLSFLKASKEAYIRVYGDSEVADKDNFKSITINKQEKKVSVKYTSGKVSEEESSNPKSFVIDKKEADEKVIETYEYRTLYGSNFVDLSELNQMITEIAGTTIVVRTKAVEEKENPGKGAPAGVEVKVKIPAAPKAPKVTIDYAKGTVKFPKKAEAKLIYTSETEGADPTTTLEDTNWTGLTITAGDQEDILGLFFGKDEDDTAKIEELIKSGFTLAVRTKADTGKKAASNPVIVSIKGVEKLEQSTDEEDDEVLLAKATIDGSDAELTWETSATGVTFTAKNGDFEYLSDASKDKWTAIKTGKLVKLDTSKDNPLQIRKSGIKPKGNVVGELPSAAGNIVIAKYEAAIESVTVEDKEVEYGKAANVKFTAVVKDVDGKEVSNPEIKWTASDDSLNIDPNTGVVSVKENTVAKTYTITATCGGKTGTAKLTVKAAN